MRSFSRGERLQLNVNINYTASHITSLAWYHNGTRIVSGSKYTISDSDTELTVINMEESDAGVYEVRIQSTDTSYTGYSNHPLCESLVLPLVETTAAHAPVTFTVQENTLPKYDPLSVVTTHYITGISGTTELRDIYPADVVSFLSLQSVGSYWSRNGVTVRRAYDYSTNEETHSLVLTYNNTEDAVGSYAAVLSFHILDLSPLCEGYREYYCHDLHICSVPLSVSFWKILLSEFESQ